MAMCCNKPPWCSDVSIRVLCVVLVVVAAGCSGSGIRDQVGWKAEDYFKGKGVIALCRAIEAKDTAEIKRLIDSGVNVNARGTDNMTPLMWAFPDTNLECFKILLEAGADPNVKIEGTFGLPQFFCTGDSVTFLCAKSRRTGFFEEVMKHGGDPNCQGSMYKRTVLTAIITSFSPRAEERLRVAIAAGADVNALDGMDSTPLVAAMSVFRQYNLAFVLLENGADPTISGKNQLGNALHQVLRAEEGLSMTDHDARELRRLRDWLEAKGYDFEGPARDLERWAKWHWMDPKDAARLRQEEIKSRQEARELGPKQ